VGIVLIPGYFIATLCATCGWEALHHLIKKGNAVHEEMKPLMFDLVFVLCNVHSQKRKGVVCSSFHGEI